MAADLILQENVPLAPLTTLKVGGPARYFVRAENELQIIDGLNFARKKDLDVLVLGGGSNVLVSDKGFDGLVIQMAMTRLDAKRSAFEKEKNHGPQDLVKVTIAAGDDWDAFVQFCVENNWAGVECLSGIPGSVGGTPVQNVGAYGQEVSETILAVRCIDTTSLEPVRLTNAECGFSYRTSIFNSTAKGRFIVYDVTFQLAPNGRPKIAYKDLMERFEGETPSLSEVREGVLQIRRAKSMVIDAEDPNRLSAGSFFKNPIVPNEKYAEIAAISDAGVPKFEVDATSVKIPAAWLIEQSGFHKGFRLGNSGISTRHTLAIINCGGASASEIVALKETIQAGVEQNFGILLQPEPVFVGF